MSETFQHPREDTMPQKKSNVDIEQLQALQKGVVETFLEQVYYPLAEFRLSPTPDMLGPDEFKHAVGTHVTRLTDRLNQITRLAVEMKLRDEIDDVY